MAVALVAKRQSVARLSTLTPGTILRFDKPCTAELELQAAGKTIARGHCVCQSQRLGILLVDRAEPDACA